MECSEVSIKLDEFIKNRLDESVMNSIKLHLSECRECSEELSVLREINGILAMDGQVSTDLGFTESVMQSLEKEREKRRRFIFESLPSVNLGASLILTGILIMLMNTGGMVTRWVDSSIQYSTDAIDRNVNTTSQSIDLLINNIINPGGK
ncbi:hypothetical protein OXPF_33320 [Oxobacter pfennigii]|uniref:Zinc-finger domain-containing protein n=1 Tax=Oxobacter pfennigii TaxID=36849 RepID=A0A0P8YTQ8_9CLOT|nr:hypothetical protein [Oxobacter pfennigii]KPU43082.1 hypothetical protein OXPF_33320 [Oxobacter pfennigii]